MFGLDTIVLTKPKYFEEPPKVIDRKFGPKQKITKIDNTSVSAVAVLEKDQSRNLVLKIYHNPYAATPIPNDVFKSKSVKEYRLTERKVGIFQEWKEI